MKCPSCNGTGVIHRRFWHHDFKLDRLESKMLKTECEHCEGTGKVKSEPQRHAATAQK